MPLWRESSYDPVCGIEDHVGGCEGDLKGQSGVSEADDAGHEDHGADEGDDPIGCVAPNVLAFFWMPV